MCAQLYSRDGTCRVPTVVWLPIILSGPVFINGSREHQGENQKQFAQWTNGSVKSHSLKFNSRSNLQLTGSYDEWEEDTKCVLLGDQLRRALQWWGQREEWNDRLTAKSECKGENAYHPSATFACGGDGAWDPGGGLCCTTIPTPTQLKATPSVLWSRGPAHLPPVAGTVSDSRSLPDSGYLLPLLYKDHCEQNLFVVLTQRSVLVILTETYRRAWVSGFLRNRIFRAGRNR